MALRVRDWRRAGSDCDFLSPMDSRKSALADDPRTECRGGKDCWRSRAKDCRHNSRRGHRPRLQRCSADADSNAHAYALVGNLECDRARTSAAFISWFCVDADAGLLLQRDLFYLRARVDA